MVHRYRDAAGFPVNIVALNHAKDLVFNEAPTMGVTLVVRELWLHETLKLLALQQLNRFHYNKPR